MAGETVGINLPTYQLTAASVTARNGEYTGTPLTDTGAGTAADPYLGVNRAGSNAPGIGISTGIVAALDGDDLDPAKWTLLDQAGAARDPQDSQHIGGDGLGEGDQTVNPIEVWDYADSDFNDQTAFVVADAQADPDEVFDTTSGAVNRTAQTIEIGDTAWGSVPVT